MNLILAIPPEFRLVGLFVIGVCMGGLINLGIYRLAWSPRLISPWSTSHAKAPPRRGFVMRRLLGTVMAQRGEDEQADTDGCRDDGQPRQGVGTGRCPLCHNLIHPGRQVQAHAGLPTCN